MKKIITLVLFSLGLNIANAENRLDSVEYKEHEKVLFEYKLNDIYEDSPESITYLGEKWFVEYGNRETKYYIQRDPEHKTISRIQVVYPFDEIRMGKEIKYLEDKYGESQNTGSKYLLIEKDNLRIRFLTDFDNIGKDNSQVYSIIEFLDQGTHSKRKESLHDIYYEERMIRR